MGRHARAVVLIWAILAALCFAGATGMLGAPSLFSRLQQAEPYVPSESHVGTDLLERADNAGPTVLLRVDGLRTTDPSALEAGTGLQRQLSALPGVRSVQSPFAVPKGIKTPQTASLFATDRDDSFLMVVGVDDELSQSARYDLATRVEASARDAFAVAPGASVSAGGGITFLHEITSQIQSWGFSFFTELDATVVNITTLLGLALCIDYGLLIVSRFREEVRRIARDLGLRSLGQDQFVEATAHTMATAGRTVFFSAVIVAISLSGLTIFPAPVIRAVGLAGVTVVLVALLVALTLVPALCAMGGRRLVRRRSDESPDDGLFARLARWVQRAHIPVMLISFGLLVALAVPTASMRQISSNTELLPAGNPQRDFLMSTARDFPMTAEPVAIVVAKASPTALGQYGRDVVSNLPGVASVDAPSVLDETHSTLSVRSTTATAENGQGRDIVAELRANRPGFETWVTGSSARLSDYLDATGARAPYAIGIVALVTIILMFLMTGSVALPLKALVINVLSLGASLGILTWIFQEGHLQTVLGFTATGGIESTTPVIMVAFGFGLAMDYELFLLSRIVELHEQGHSDADAVRLGLQRSGRIITSAALLILIVLGGLAFGQMIVVKQIGIGLGISIVLDATLVRMLLVPATMHVLGAWNWWAPPPLRRWHQRLGLQH